MKLVECLSAGQGRETGLTLGGLGAGDALVGVRVVRCVLHTLPHGAPCMQLLRLGVGHSVHGRFLLASFLGVTFNYI